MRKWNPEAAIENMKQHKQFFIDSWGGFGKMPKEDKARCDEIDNCIAELYNTSVKIYTRYVTIELKYYLPQDTQAIFDILNLETSWFDEDVDDYVIEENKDGVEITIMYRLEPVPGAGITPIEKVQEMFMKDISRTSLMENPLLLDYAVEVEDE